MDLDDFQTIVGDWADRTFPQSTIASMIAHLRDEVDELERDPNGPEAADCFLILLHIADRLDISLKSAAQQKFEIAKRRRWGEPDSRGVSRHIEDDELPGGYSDFGSFQAAYRQ